MKNGVRKPIAAILFAAIMMVGVLAVPVASVSAETGPGYYSGNDLLELYIGETQSDYWVYIDYGQSCTQEIYSIWYNGAIHYSYSFQVIDPFGDDTTAILKTLDGNVEVTRTIYIPSGSERYFTISYMLKNTGSEALTDVRFFEKVNYDVPWSGKGRDDNAWYDSANDSVWIEDPVYYKNGFTGSISSSNHGIDLYYYELADDEDGELNGVDSMTGDVAVGLQYDIGDLEPGAAWEITMTFWFGEPYPITVVDTTPPVITCPDDITVEQETIDGTVVPLTATATDDCDADVEITSDAPEIFPPGTTTVTFTATDDSGNEATGTVDVTVVDTTPPELTIPADVTVEQETVDGTVVSLTATATDICDADVEITSNAPEIFPPGTTTVTFTATDDSGNEATGTVDVTVVDTTPPVITCPDAVTVEQETAAGTEVSLTATATDICDADPTITSDAPEIFPLGTTTVTFTATDDSGNEATGTVDVTVVDTTPPEITCPDAVTVEQETAAGTEVSLTATATDICDADPTITSDAPEIFPLGTTTVTFTATDDSGNSASCSMDVIVTVIEPMDLKKQAISELEAAKTGDKKTDKKIDKAIKHIQKSLEGKLWVDGLHLDAKHGNKVFNEEKKAVKHLMKCPTSDDIIEMLVQADEGLAITAIDDAEETPVIDGKKQDKVDKEIAKAKDELAKAEDKFNEGKPDKAIDHYKKAWKHAQQAIKHAQ